MKILERTFGTFLLVTLLLAVGVRRRPMPVCSDVGRARVQMKTLGEAIRRYRHDHERLPPSLDALLDPDPRGEPYVRSIPVDPWGQPYVRAVDDASDVRLACHGPDGTPGTDDDIVWPTRGSP